MEENNKKVLNEVSDLNNSLPTRIKRYETEGAATENTEYTNTEEGEMSESESPRKQLQKTLASGKWDFEIDCESEVLKESKMLTLMAIPNSGKLIADSGRLNSFYIRKEEDLSILQTINHDFGSLFVCIISN